ncbi:hypothetical protein LXL04_001044 [Taraxacum kok-saghyz]
MGYTASVVEVPRERRRSHKDNRNYSPEPIAPGDRRNRSSRRSPDYARYDDDFNRPRSRRSPDYSKSRNRHRGDSLSRSRSPDYSRYDNQNSYRRDRRSPDYPRSKKSPSPIVKTMNTNRKPYYGDQNKQYLDRDNRNGNGNGQDSDSDEELKGASYEDYRRLKRQKLRKMLKHCIWNITPSPPRRDDDPDEFELEEIAEEAVEEKEKHKDTKSELDSKDRSRSSESDSESKSESDESESDSDDSRSRRRRKKSKSKSSSSRRRHRSRKSVSVSESSSQESSDESEEEDRRRKKKRKSTKRKSTSSRRHAKRKRRSTSRKSKDSDSEESSESNEGNESLKSKRSRSSSSKKSENSASDHKSDSEADPDLTAIQQVDESEKTEMDSELMLFKEMIESRKKSGLPVDDEEPEVGPMPLPRAEGHISYGGALRPGEGDAIAQYVQQGKRIPRRGEVGLSAEEISKFEDLGYVMSGSRHQRMNAIRIRKENQVYSAEDKRALAMFNYEEKAKREQKVMADLQRLVQRHIGEETGPSHDPFGGAVAYVTVLHSYLELDMMSHSQIYGIHMLVQMRTIIEIENGGTNMDGS